MHYIYLIGVDILSYSLAFTQAIAITLRIGVSNQYNIDEYVSTKELSNLLNIPKPSVVSILSKLSNSGLLKTKEGIKGGFMLTKKPSEVTLLEIFQSIESKKNLFRTDIEINITNEKKRDMFNERLTNKLKLIEDKMKGELEKVYLSELYIK